MQSYLCFRYTLKTTGYQEAWSILGQADPQSEILARIMRYFDKFLSHVDPILGHYYPGKVRPPKTKNQVSYDPRVLRLGAGWVSC